MGTKVHTENYLRGYHPMREFNQDSGKNSRPPPFCDKPLSNGLYFEHLPPANVLNSRPRDDHDVAKERILEHDAVFKGQVSGLHRHHGVQRDMIGEGGRKEMRKHMRHVDLSSTSSPIPCQMALNDGWKWHKPNYPLADPIFPSPSVSGYSKGNNTHTGASQDRFSSKVGDTLDSRPSKVRKRLFDLQLPAEDYVDAEEEEHSLDHKLSDHSRSSPGRYHEISLGRNMVSNLAGGVHTRNYKNGYTSASHSRDSVAMAGLGKNIEVEESHRPRSVNFVDIHNFDSSSKPESQFLLGLSEQHIRSTHQNNYMASRNIEVPHDRVDRGWLSNMNGPGYNMARHSSQALQLDKSHVSSPNSVNHPSDYKGRDLCIDRTACDLEFSGRNHHQSVLKYQKPVDAYPYLFPSAPDSMGNWSHAASVPEQLKKSSIKNFTSSQPPSLSLLGTSGRTIQSCGLSSDTSKEKCHVTPSNGSNLPFDCGRPNYNSFPDSSAPRSKDMNRSKEERVSELSTKWGVESYSKGPNTIDRKPAIDMNLNTCVDEYEADVEIVCKERKFDGCLEGLPWLKRRSNNQNECSGTRMDLNSLESRFPQAASDQLCHKNETVKDPVHHFTENSTLASHGGEVAAKRSKGDNSLVSRKIFGFSMFDKPSTSKTESCLDISPRASLPSLQEVDVKNDLDNGLFDLNVAFDPVSFEKSTKEDLLIEKVSDIKVSKLRNFDLNSCLTDDEATLEPSSSGTYIDNSDAFDATPVTRSTREPVIAEKSDKRVVNFRSHIDLNSCVTEEEVTLETSCSSAYVNVKRRFVIDLEVPAAPESEEDTVPMEEHVLPDTATESSSLNKVPKFHDEAIVTAAEAMIAISSDKRDHEEENVSADSLLWFVDVISCYWDNRATGMALESYETDEFEAMALNLTELKEEEYMPKPLFPGSLKLEERRNMSSPHQARRGRGKRGRQRKDFQRDILPSLVSLSRHEVTRDLQTFGGMMQATGHSWNVDSTRRGRGRPRRSDVNLNPLVSP